MPDPGVGVWSAVRVATAQVVCATSRLALLATLPTNASQQTAEEVGNDVREDGYEHQEDPHMPPPARDSLTSRAPRLRGMTTTLEI
jgi:hypothetical protein